MSNQTVREKLSAYLAEVQNMDGCYPHYQAKLLQRVIAEAVLLGIDGPGMVEILVTGVRIFPADPMQPPRTWMDENHLSFRCLRRILTNASVKRAWQMPGWIETDEEETPAEAALSATLWLLDWEDGLVIFPDEEGRITTL